MLLRRRIETTGTAGVSPAPSWNGTLESVFSKLREPGNPLLEADGTPAVPVLT